MKSTSCYAERTKVNTLSRWVCLSLILVSTHASVTYAKPTSPNSTAVRPTPSISHQPATIAAEGRATCTALGTLLTKPSLTRRQLSDFLAPRGERHRRYRSARRLLFSQVAIERQDTPPMITALYTGRRVPSRARRSPHGFNCEHLWPRAWMSSKRSSAYRRQEADLHNLYPSEIRVNSRRGHLPFGVVTRQRAPYAQPSKIGENIRGVEVVEVRDPLKGDVARTLIYMALRWGLNFPAGQDLDLLAEWSAGDPPSERERERDQRISQLQGNHNPLVSCPQLTGPAINYLKR